MQAEPTVIAESLVHQGRFLTTKILHWRDARGQLRDWEAAERASWSGAVLIIPRLVPSGRLLLIRQYRPPTRCFVYEFPAGLVDKGESPEGAALRELREETGFAAAKIRLFPEAYTTPGMSNESVSMVLAEIDETAAENREPETAFDASESIETLFVAEKDLGDFYRRECERGNAFDAKLAAYILAAAMR